MLKKLVKSAARRFGYKVSRIVLNEVPNCELDRFRWLMSVRDAQANQPLDEFLSFCAKHFMHSKSQLFQDLLVLHALSGKRNGYFVEFGATDGVCLSNTYLLEKEYGWNGILAEPAKAWHKNLMQNRSAHICFDCVWSKSGESLAFQETEWKEISTIASFANGDAHAQARQRGSSYMVQTISLNDLLDRFKAPTQIDYLSIDTEGSEFDILSSLDFHRWRFQVVTVEHNFTAARDRLSFLLESNGYRRIFSELSSFDDWYLHSSLG